MDLVQLFTSRLVVQQDATNLDSSVKKCSRSNVHVFGASVGVISDNTFSGLPALHFLYCWSVLGSYRNNRIKRQRFSEHTSRSNVWLCSGGRFLDCVWDESNFTDDESVGAGVVLPAGRDKTQRGGTWPSAAATSLWSPGSFCRNEK